MTGLTTTASHLVAPSQFIGPGRLEQAGTVGASSGLASRCSALQEHPPIAGGEPVAPDSPGLPLHLFLVSPWEV